MPVATLAYDRPIREAVGEGRLLSWTDEEQGVFSFGFANSRYQKKELNQTLLKLCKDRQTRSLVDYKMIMASYFPHDKPLAIMIVNHLNCRQLIQSGRTSNINDIDLKKAPKGMIYATCCYYSRYFSILS